jgi:hypothetical protein
MLPLTSAIKSEGQINIFVPNPVGCESCSFEYPLLRLDPYYFQGN